MVYLGVDWSVKEIVCAAIAGREGPIFRQSGVSPVLAEVEALLESVRRVLGEQEVAAFIEPGAPQWQRLLYAAGAQVFVVDGKQARRFAESMCSSGAKDDRRDAEMLARMGRSGEHRLRAWMPRSSSEQRLSRLVREYTRATQRTTPFIQQLRSRLREEMPQVEAQFTSLRAAWVRRLLERAPTLWHLRQVDRETLDTLLRPFRVSQVRRAALWQAIQESEAPWLDEAVADIDAEIVCGHLAVLELFLHQEKTLYRLLEEELLSFKPAKQMLEIKGLGPVITSTVLVFGMLGAQPDGGRDALSVRLGASPVFIGSGKTRKGRPKGKAVMRRSSPSIARRATYLLGRLISMHTRWGKAMYADGRRRGQSAATAYRRLARSMLRIISALIRSGEPYDEERYIRVLQDKGVDWAKGIELEKIPMAAK